MHRTRNENLLTAEHACDGPGVYRAGIKVIDISGNDAAKPIEVEIM